MNPQDWMLAATAVFAVNLLPAFGPPTWALLVVLRVNLAIAAVPLVLVGAVSAAAGRLLLASAARAGRSRLAEHRRRSLEPRAPRSAASSPTRCGPRAPSPSSS